MKVIDLSYDIEEGMITFGAAWHPIVSFTQLGRLNYEGRETHEISLGSHTGTHIDAPRHFIKNGGPVDTIDLCNLIGDVSLVDFSFLRDNEIVTKEMLTGRSLKKKILFNFGWGKHWNTRSFYKGYPFFSKHAAEYLVSLGTELIGMDTPSPDDSRITLNGETLGGDSDSPIHKIFLSKRVILLEYVANLDKIADLEGWKIIVMPLRLKGLDGSPVRVCIYKENET